MSVYNFAHSINPNLTEDFAYWENGFTESELQQIVSYGEKLIPKKASITGKSLEEDFKEFRESRVSWIQLNEDTHWLYEKIAYIARNLNSRFFQFDLSGFVEDFQYTVYDGDTRGHYDWHVDAINNKNANSPRKLSMVLQLSDPTEYEGGEFQLMNSKNPLILKKEKGFLAAFPSYMLHRVTPVTKGTRKTLVIWISGPQFR